MKTNNFAIATVVITIATVLCGCPNTGNLIPMIHTETEGGQPSLVTLNQVDEAYAPYGALMTYEGGRGFKEAEATFYLHNVPEPIVQTITATGSEEKCLSCAASANLIIAGAIATTYGVIALVRESEDSFDIAIPMGNNLVTCIMRVVGNDGSFAITTFRGLAYYDDSIPEPEESFVLSTEISPFDAGRIVVNPDYESYWLGEEVQVTAVSNSGYEFSHWVVNGEIGIEDPVAYVTMDSDVQLIAVFTTVNPEPEEGEPVEGECEGEDEGEVEDQYTLTASASPAGSGTVTGAGTYPAGQTISVTATPATGWMFSHWMVNGTTGITNPVAQVTMDSDVELVAVFTQTSATDTIPPVITLNGANPVSLNVGDVWNDPGATAVDAIDGIVLISITGTVNTTVIGTYTVTYTANDASGNIATAIRTVNVGQGSEIKDPINVALAWNGTALSATITGSTAPVVGFQIYQFSAPYFNREVWNVINGSASGVVTNFRYSVNHIFRFDVVESDGTGGYVNQKRITFNGGLPATLVTTPDGTAFEVRIP